MANSNTVWAEIKAGVVTAIGALALTSDDGTLTVTSTRGVYPQLLADLSYPSFPAVAVTTEGMKPTWKGGDTEYRHREYPVLVSVVDRDLRRTTGREADYLAWMESIRTAFHEIHRPVTLSVATKWVNWCEADPAENFRRVQNGQPYLETRMTLRFLVIEPR
jgi:hypothetical protein